MNTRWRKFFSYYRPYRGLLALDILCALIAACASLLLPIFVRVITKDILEGGLADPIPSILRTGAGMLALVALQAACTYFYDYRGHAMGAMMERDMRAELFDHVQRLSFTYHDTQRPGALLSRMTHDLLSLAELYHHFPEDMAVYAVKFIGALCILLSISAPLTLVVMLFLPPVALFTISVGRRMNAAMRDNLEKIADVNAMVEENLSGIKVVQSFTNEPLEMSKFSRENNRHLKSREAIYGSEARFSTGIIVFSQCITIAVVVFGGIAITRKSLDLADLITFLLYVGFLVEPMTRLAHTIQQVQEGLAGFDRFLEIMNTIPSVQETPSALALSQVRGDVAFCGVDFAYEDGRPVLCDIFLEIRAGETVAIVGESGVGKTTLCSLIPRFYDPIKGKVLVDGKDIRDVTLDSLRAQIGTVQQDVYLFSGSILENIMYGRPGASETQAIEAARQAGAHSFIEAMLNGYSTQIGHRGVRLSGGQRQRLSIARAFLKNPPILIMDEATSALDSETERIVQASLNALAKDRTTFIIAHRLSTIENADRIVVLSDHHVAEQGTHASLMAQDGVYARLYKTRSTLA
ncbi:ABC transporter ATP-binding protein/permease [Eubacteriales bacterium OttesenSCG-928-A19]|nr:ABC transporter ATP-binding protein/permease [Eubacteriales bacterium OttesenSCG-928-A19]